MLGLEIGQILTQIVAFLIMLWILKRYAWIPLLKVMDDRKKKIISDFDSIDKQKKELKKQNEEYEARLKGIDDLAKNTIQEALNTGRKMAQEIQEETRLQAKAILNRAHSEVERELQRTKGKLKEEMVDIAIAAAGKILDKELDPEAQKKIISEFVEKEEFK